MHILHSEGLRTPFYNGGHADWLGKRRRRALGVHGGHLAEVLRGSPGANQSGRARIPMECAVVRAKLWANGQPRGICALSSRRLAGSPLIA